MIRSNVLLMLIMHLPMLSYREGGGGGQAQVAYLSETEFCVQMPHCRPFTWPFSCIDSKHRNRHVSYCLGSGSLFKVYSTIH